MVRLAGSPLLVIVTGKSATGKTTLARRLADDARLPLIHKDTLKESLFDSLGVGDRAHSRRLGYASIQLARALTRELLGAGVSLVLESNFSEALDGQFFRALRQETDARIAQIWLMTETEALLMRWDERARSGLRHAGHVELANAGETHAMLRAPDDQPLSVSGSLMALDTTAISGMAYSAALAFVQMSLDGAWDAGESS